MNIIPEKKKNDPIITKAFSSQEKQEEDINTQENSN